MNKLNTKNNTLTINSKAILQNVLFALALTTCIFLNIHPTHIDCEAKELHNIIELVRKDDTEEESEVTLKSVSKTAEVKIFNQNV